jgi:hypothetical protein
MFLHSYTYTEDTKDISIYIYNQTYVYQYINVYTGIAMVGQNLNTFLAYIYKFVHLDV